MTRSNLEMINIILKILFIYLLFKSNKKLNLKEEYRYKHYFHIIILTLLILKINSFIDFFHFLPLPLNIKILLINKL